MDEASLAAIEGVGRTDARNIVHYLSRLETPAKVEETPSQPDSKERVIAYLMRVPRMNELKAEMIYDAGYDSVERSSTLARRTSARSRASG
jgi:demethoxyubiquinone hydroxylase (CLK1/Coq7/Cat5 family)